MCRYRTTDMNLQIKNTLAGVDWAEVATVFEKAPLGQREPEQLRRAFERSYRTAVAYDGDRLIGVARLLSDGEYYAAIYDVVILPDYQRRGIGTALMANLTAGIDVGSWILISVPGKEGFYGRQGFVSLKTGMVRYRDPERARSRGFID